ncbi:MAG: exodeoxyribonuclease V subunit gamma [Candidatus Gastranaerophilales bacterium]|nr:exodeoxyribonuclease V subunit gamma [Candidatus Gastranaerophilales bacterium]
MALLYNRSLIGRESTFTEKGMVRGMSLRFYFGPSGVGKSREVYAEIIGRSLEHPEQNFLIIVPDQFTMQTQKDLVTLHDRGGIMNIDVLSFGRLSHRILEEVGTKEIPVLDDTGKSLVLQKVAANVTKQLPTLGSFLHRQGYIHEVKSAISEFMQYGIGVEDLDKLIEYAQRRGALSLKLKDLQTLYRAFQEYIKGNFITTEETLDVLRNSLSKSRLLPGSVVVFDGFTGFTPIQNRLIQELMRVCGETIVTVTMGAGENPYESDAEQRLFHLSKKTTADLEKLAKEAGVSRGQDVFLLAEKKSALHVGSGERVEGTSEPNGEEKRNVFAEKCELRYKKEHRFMETPALLRLEQGLFRYRYEPFVEDQEEIQIFETLTPRDEVHQTGLYMKELIREKNWKYRDMAVIVGDLESYAPYVEAEFAQMEIPCYIDRTRGIRLNPLIEYIESALELYLQDFSYESVFHYLRSGLSDIAREETDILENYVIRTGIRGYRRYDRLFTAKISSAGEDEELLGQLNDIRERLVGQVAMLHGQKTVPVKEHVNRLYDFLTQNQVQQKLVRFEHMFLKEGDLSREREYAQIYRLVMELLDQVYALLGEETISLQEFADILAAGFDEIEVGTIPQNVDRVVVGDMERTRLKQVKALFFLGINDGNIPKSASKGGIISDMDREFLRESQLELAPSPRQQMFIQRLYLYLNMTKPSQKLYLSYSKLDSKGKSIRPAYLVDVVRKMFPQIEVKHPQNRSAAEQIVTPKEGMRYLAEDLREYAAGSLREGQETEFFTIFQAYSEGMFADRKERLTEAAFKQYQDSGLAKAVARALYGKNLENSVTRLETFASCAYRHFMQYGLTLREREEFGFEAVDMGNVYHAVLEIFAAKLAESGYTWFDFPKEFGERAVREALEEYAASYGETVLYSSARNEYAITRMGRILVRTVLTLQSQLKQGTFAPESYEMSFHFAQDLESVNVTLSEGERMHLKGRIDRIDTAQDGEHVYVKVIDYKSGNRQFDIAALYYGLQLQLVVYMNAAMEMEARRHPDKEVVPAALLYYHIDDPTVETAVELSEEEINGQILSKLRMSGVVNGEPDIVERLDRSMGDRSDIIPAERKKDGSYTARSGVMSASELRVVSDYVNYKVKQIGREILDGRITVDPYEKGTESACTYCAYKNVCGFDRAVPGYEMRELEPMGRQEALEKMKEIEK